MGKMTLQEWIVLAVFFLMLFLWVFGGIYIIHFDEYFTFSDVELIKSDSTTTALVGVSILLLTGVLQWNDVIDEKGAWDTLFWFATLMMMAGFLSKLGVIVWMSNSMQGNVSNMHWGVIYAVLVFGYFYSHYLFASNAAHISSLFTAFAVLGISAGVPPLLMIFSLAFTSSLSACITHYGTAPGPIFFGSGYVDLRTWWKLGAIISVVHLFVWIGLGSIWWKVIGLW